jgi:SWI/SNF-related matrix-associated actin-dependent regulator of chromatin subfamily A-like protein 1
MVIFLLDFFLHFFYNVSMNNQVAEIQNQIQVNCCFCGRDLTDALSQERGYGPICAVKYGMLFDTTCEPAANADELIETAINNTNESRKHVAEGTRIWKEDKKLAAKRLSYLLSFVTTQQETDSQLLALEAIGFRAMAGIIANQRQSDAVAVASKVIAKVEIQGELIFVTTAKLCCTEALDEVRTIKGRRWRNDIRANTFPASSWDAVMAWTLKWYPLSSLPERPDRLAQRASVTPVVAEESEYIVHLSLLGKRIQIESPYNKDFVTEVKEIPNRQWTCLECGKPARPKCEIHSTGKHGWTVPLDRAEALKSLVKKYYSNLKSTVSPELEQALSTEDKKIETAQKVEEKEISLPGGKTFPFQSAGIQYLEASNGNAIIADEQGLGKTIQALAYVHRNVPKDQKILYIVPANVKYNWVSEISHWLGGAALNDMKILKTARKNGKVVVGEEEIAVLNGDKPNSSRLGRHTIINYDSLAKWEEVLVNANFQIVIADEAHYIKNKDSKRSKSFAKIVESAKSKILLTGTPVLNRPKDLWNLLRTIDNETWGHFFKFATRYCGARSNGYGYDFDGATNTEELHDRLNGHQWIRRMKSDVLSDLPEKVRNIVTLDLPVEDRSIYKAMEEEGGKIYHTSGKLASSGDAEARASILGYIARLRRVLGNSKTQAASNWIQDLVDSCGKVVVFARHKEVVEELAEKFGGLKIDGSVPSEKRADIINKFQTTDAPVIVCSIEAASVGITLTAASHLVFVERVWRAGDHHQAEDRIHRIGQKNQATIWYLDASETFDDALRALIDWKAEQSDIITDGKSSEESEKVNVISAFNKYFEDKEEK